MSMSENNKKLIYFLPNTFTALNMACGFACIMLSIRGDYYKSCIALMLGVIFDSVDGRIARVTGTQSAFGEQFDSLSDLITFGAAPALLYYLKFLTGFNRVGMVVAFIYLLCGALRLARFNANIDRIKVDYFQGIPIPGAAAALVGFVLSSLIFDFFNVHAILALFYMLFYSVLMISSVPFPSFKHSPWVKSHKKHVLFIIFLAISSILIYEEIMVLALVTLYVLSSILYFLTHKGELSGIFKWDNDGDLEN